MASDNVYISDCTVSEMSMNFPESYLGNVDTFYFGGIVGRASKTTITNCWANAYVIDQDHDMTKYIGGIVGYGKGICVEDCFFDGSLEISIEQKYEYYLGGIVGYVDEGSSTMICNNLFQGSLQYYRDASGKSWSNATGGIVGAFNRYPGTLKNNISNGTMKNKLTSVGLVYAAGVCAGSNTPTGISSNVYNSGKMTIISNPQNPNYAKTGATTDANMKLASTYASWENFDEHWVINSNINNGYPMLRKFIPVAQVTGFAGSGTEADPYLIKTQQDLLGMSSYYNNNPLVEENVYWRLVNNIGMSTNANGLPIHFTPICYNKEFDGYFDGNNKTISGLLIDNQYAYTGLFGTISANHYVKDLTVTGNIYWDQAYAVGGVAGRVMTGGYLQNCTFTGNIIGVLNTKTSTECHGVVGNYGIGGAIDCSATYKDIKYAKISGTAESPTYTYYLYDWAQINTNLYDRRVG